MTAIRSSDVSIARAGPRTVTDDHRHSVRASASTVLQLPVQFRSRLKSAMLPHVPRGDHYLKLGFLSEIFEPEFIPVHKWTHSVSPNRHSDATEIENRTRSPCIVKIEGPEAIAMVSTSCRRIAHPDRIGPKSVSLPTGMGERFQNERQSDVLIRSENDRSL